MKNYIQLITAITFTVLFSNSVKAQSQISFFHLGDYVQQSTDVSPVYIPKNSFSFGLPGVAISAQSGLSYKDMFTQNNTNINSVDADFENIYNSIDGDYNNINISQKINILNLAFKRKRGSISFFLNQNANFSWKMSKNGVANLLNNGLEKINNTIFVNDKVSTNVYAEAGIGFTQQFLKERLAIGVRVKYLIGAVNGHTDENGSASILVNNSNYNYTLNANNAIARTAGTDTNNFDDYKFNTNNTGLGLDIGATFKITENFEVEAAINDIGSITWKSNVKEYSLVPVTNKQYQGTNLRSDNDILDDLENIFETEEKQGDSYKASLATTSYLSASYKFRDIHQFRATMFNNHQLEDSEAVLALGYNLALKKTTYGLVAIKNGVGAVDFGLNLATKLGPFQIYAATDNLNQILGKPEEIKQANVRFGINLVFGYKKWLEDKE